MYEHSLIPELVKLIMLARDGDRNALVQLGQHEGVPGRKALVEICRIAVANVNTKDAGASTTKPRHVAPPAAYSPRVTAARSFTLRTGRFTNRCTVCDRPAIPGDSVCYTHNN